VREIDVMTRRQKNVHSVELLSLYASPNIRMIKLRRKRLAKDKAWMGAI
jgi:hypothetical protein